MNPRDLMAIARVVATCSFIAVLVTGCLNKGRVGRGSRDIATVKDRDGNVYSIKVMPDSMCWMTRNLNIDVAGSYCYANEKSNCEEYGRLYIWEAAAEGCRLLGEGWRLPSNEEWQEMAKLYGGVIEDSEDGGKAAYEALQQEGYSGFGALLGGSRNADGDYARLDAHGFYWSASESSVGHAWFYNFGRGASILNHHEDGNKQMACSVRCVRNMDRKKK